MKAILGLALGVILVSAVFANSANAEYSDAKKADAEKDKSAAYDISSLVNNTIHSKIKEQTDKKTDTKKIDIKKLTKSKGKPIRKIKQN